MQTPAFTSFLPLNIRRRPHTNAPRVSLSHRSIYACQSQDSKPVRSEPAPITRRDAIPSLFRGPEAVLGIVIAAAALLADFSRNLARLISRPRPALKSAHDLDDSIALLSSALDASKVALADTETRLDESLARASSAETALLGIGDTREAMRRARENTQEAEAELRRITSLLVEQREHFEEVTEEKEKTSEKREEFENAIKERENEVSKLRALVAEAQATEKQIETTYKEREEELRTEMDQKQQELEAVRTERLRAEEQATDLEVRAATIAEQAEAAEFALEETKRELERVQSDVEARQKERRLVDAENARAQERSKETDKLRKMVRDMERELSELQTELRSRDQVVNEFAMESDELRSLLAARDAELRDVNSRLDSAMASDIEKGGDSGLSEVSLNEIQRNLDAERLALSAEITKAELASMELTEDDLDPLVRIKKEMGAEENLLQAGLRKAESTVSMEEHLGTRKENALDDVMKSIDEEGEEDMPSADAKDNSVFGTASDQGDQDDITLEVTPGDAIPVADDVDSMNEDAERTAVGAELDEGNNPVEKEGQAEVASDVESMVAKQAQTKREEAETKPRRRRGRPRKNSSTNVASSDPTQETRPKRRRGRPRKSEPGEWSSDDSS